ncbi:MAG TPA: DegT/DnrJ/EryC1/StrS family aminotransferase [Azospirillaceae bacterium]|nr:DegT/DnrJ/EryC1/StrS family aminotransferase [Azospirillaceae bacterium]
MTVNAPIPQTDPRAGYLAAKAEIDAAIQRVLDSGWFILGKEVEAFEAEFAAFVGPGQHGVGVANGTDALVVALRALGVGPGDGVVTVAHTAVATVAAVELVGATPIVVDIDQGHTMDPGALQAALERPAAPVKAIIPVHLYGQPADLGPILDIARGRGIPVIEDCSQAHGAVWNGKAVGNHGDIAAFSLYPTKNLGALGDGGIITTPDAGLAAKMKALREYGWKERYISDIPGQNTRLDELQAAILRVKLQRLPAENARRQAIAAVYDAGLAEQPVERPWRRPGTTHVFHQYAIRHPRRDALKAALREQGVMTNVHYPVPVHLQPAYQGRIALGPGGLPNTERAALEVLSLPMFGQLTDDQAKRVVAALADACARPLAA